MPVTFQYMDAASYAAGVLETDGRMSRDWPARGGAKRRRSSESDPTSLLDTASSGLAWSATVNPAFRSLSFITHSTSTFVPVKREPSTESEPWRPSPRGGAPVDFSPSSTNRFLHRGSRLSKMNASYLGLAAVAVLLLASAASSLRKGLVLLGQESSPASDGLPEATKSAQLSSEVWGDASANPDFSSAPAPHKVQASRALGMLLEHMLLHGGGRGATSFGSSVSAVRPGGMLHFDGTTSASYDAPSSFGSLKLWGGYDPLSADTGSDIKSLGEREPAIEFEPWQRTRAMEAHAQLAAKWSINSPIRPEHFASGWRVSLPDSDYAPESGSGSSTPSVDTFLEDWPSSSTERGLKMRTRNSDSESSSSGASGPTSLPPPLPPGRRRLGPLKEQQRSTAPRKTRRHSGDSDGSPSKAYWKRSRPSRRARSDSGDSPAQAKPVVPSFSDKARPQDHREPGNYSHRIPGAPPNSPFDVASQTSRSPGQSDAGEHFAYEGASDMQRRVASFVLDDKLNASGDASGEAEDSADELEAISGDVTPDSMSRAPERLDAYNLKNTMLYPSASNALHLAGGDATSEGLPPHMSSALPAAGKLNWSVIGQLRLPSDTDEGMFPSRPVFPDLPGANSRHHRVAFPRTKTTPPVSTEAVLVSVRQTLEDLVSSGKAD